MTLKLIPWRRLTGLVIVISATLLILRSSSVPPGDQTSRVRAHTRPIEFDFVDWTLQALSIKGEQTSLAIPTYLEEADQQAIVLAYLELVSKAQRQEAEIQDIYANPATQNPQADSAPLRVELEALEQEKARLGPLAESILQSQLQEVLASLDLSLGGQPVPPVLYRVSAPPMALIVSPRAFIRQDETISIDPDLSVDLQAALEAEVDRSLNVSSLVVPIGGIGLYPTMVKETNDINWLAEVVAHEWIHNFLTLRPLGLLYLQSPELRTMNETVASIAGKELGRALVARFYPEFLPPLPEPTPQPRPVEPAPDPDRFDFRAEMGKTRIRVDELLAAGRIDEAEAYMEARREFFWQNGYRLRKINQAYFAFYGAYADQPGGASEGDPVGEAVRQLRAESPTLAQFVKRASWLTSFDQLQEVISASP